MQLDLFGALVAATPNEAALTEFLDEDIDALDFGPVNKIEAQTNVAFVSNDFNHAIKRDAFEALQRTGRLAKIVEEATLDRSMRLAGFDERKSTVQDQYVPMILDKLNGMTYAALAVKYQRTPQSIYALMSRPATRQFVAKLLSEYAQQLGEADKRIQYYAHEAIETVVDIMRTGKEENKQKSAFAILRMGGYDRSASPNVVVNNNVGVTDNTAMAEAADRLSAVLEQSARIREHGSSKYVDQSRSVRVDDEIAVVEAPEGLKRLSA